jgi:hypothetical protein
LFDMQKPGWEKGICIRPRFFCWICKQSCPELFVS